MTANYPIYSMDQKPIKPFRSFQEAAIASVKSLHDRYGFNLWMVTHTLVDDWIVLAAEDNGYDISAGDVFNWSDSFCSRMVRNEGPRIAPDANKIDIYRQAPIAQKVNISSYIGVPISIGDGSLFGTLCAIDPKPQPQKLEKELPFIELQARLLSSILSMEIQLKDKERFVQHIQAESPVDSVSDLLNIRGWNRAIHTENDRHSRLERQATAAIFVIDPDGPELSDEHVKLVATTLRTSFRPFDVIGRLDERTFGVLITDLSESSKHLCQRARELLAKLGLPLLMGTANTAKGKNLEKAVEEARQHVEKNR